MECQIHNLGASGVTEEDIPKGKVESVCREWSVREDCVLAHKLQSEEIQHHYGYNKEKNQLVRSDFQEARIAQKDEEEEAEMIQKAYEDWIKEQQDRDAFIAKQLQEKILQEQLEYQKEIEEKDKLIALELQKKEKLRLQKKREDRERRQAERAVAELSGTSSAFCVQPAEGFETNDNFSTEFLAKEIADFSIKPPENLSSEESARFQEYYDAEFARKLQELEMKMQNENSPDRQLAIEAQDRELAKVLQEQERARLRKAREKNRQKAALLQQQQELNESEHSTEVKLLPKDNSDLDKNQGSIEKIPKNTRQSVSDSRYVASNFFGDPVDNIATAIDPTYQPYSTPSPVAVPSLSTDLPLCDVSRIERDCADAEESEVAAPPYMPIQGTCRSSLEKRKKCKKRKENCKTH